MHIRQKVLNQIETAWSSLKDSCAGLSEAELTRPGVTGGWSVKDILAHITTWEEEALKYLPLIAKGGTPPRYSRLYGGIHAFNAQSTKAKQALSLSEILRQLDETHLRLIQYIRRVPERHLASESRFRRRLRQDSYGHIAKHARAIRKWRSAP